MSGRIKVAASAEDRWMDIPRVTKESSRLRVGMHMQAIPEGRALGAEMNSCGWCFPESEGLLNLVKVIGCCFYEEYSVSYLTVAAGFFLQSEGLLTLVKTV